MATLKIINQILERDACPTEAWHSAQDFGVDYDDGRCHLAFHFTVRRLVRFIVALWEPRARSDYIVRALFPRSE